MDLEQAQYWILGLGIGLPAVGAVLYWFLTRHRRREMMGQAEVISKTPELGYGGKWSSSWNYKIVFRVGGAEFPLYVLKSDYETIQEGMTGILIWQEENLLSFTPNEE